MFQASTVVAVQDSSGADKRNRNQTVSQLKAERRRHERDVYQARKEAGLCTRCGETAPEGKNMCPPCDEYMRTVTRRAVQALRSLRRKRGRCAGCGRKSVRYTCDGCLLRQRRLPQSRMPRLISNQTVNQSRVDSVVEADGYVRTRYVGQPRKGAPSKASTDATDLKFGGASWARATAGLTEIMGDPHMTKSDRDLKRQEWLGQLDHARRTAVEILERNGYEIDPDE